jgi:pimeloyl-ACP methyl ester carboxylesterase
MNVRRLWPSTSESPVLYVHGLGGSALNFTALMRAMGQRDQIAPDLPGFGYSPPPDDGDYTPAGAARAVAALLEQLVPGRSVHLVGNSMGGAVAVVLAEEHPELVRSLTLLSPALPDRRPGAMRAQVGSVALPVLGPRLARAVLQMDADRRVSAMLQMLYGDPTVATPGERASAAAEFRRRAKLPYAEDVLVSATRGMVAAYLETGPSSLWRRAARIDVPTLLIYSRHDRIVDPRHAQRAYATFPNATVRVLAGTGHVAQMERPRLVAGLLQRHLALAD